MHEKMDLFVATVWIFNKVWAQSQPTCMFFAVYVLFMRKQKMCWLNGLHIILALDTSHFILYIIKLQMQNFSLNLHSYGWNSHSIVIDNEGQGHALPKNP